MPGIMSFQSHTSVTNVRKVSRKFTKCDKRFALKSALTKHTRGVHDKVITATCDICQKGFLFKSKLERHTKVHEN